MYVFGPVPSRRLGMSIGVNNIPPKICSYSCAYCQIGNSLRMSATREHFYDAEMLIKEVELKLTTLEESQAVDYITVVADGEPTLDSSLLDLIKGLKRFGIPVAIINNASLIDHEAVQEALSYADWVSLKVDAVQETVWRRIDRPLRTLDLEAIMKGMQQFAALYQGFLATETMLVSGINDCAETVKETAQFIGMLSPGKSYISIPTRPPASSWVHAPDEKTINQAYQLFCDSIDSVELLIGYEGNAFAYTGNVQEDLLSITAVHPMREDAVDAYLQRAHSSYAQVQDLVEEGLLRIVWYGDKRFLHRVFAKRY